MKCKIKELKKKEKKTCSFYLEIFFSEETSAEDLARDNKAKNKNIVEKSVTKPKELAISQSNKGKLGRNTHFIETIKTPCL